MPMLLETTMSARKIFAEMIQKAQLNGTSGSCMYACVFLAAFISKFVPGCTTIIRGGDGVADGYYLNQSGEKCGHYWVEASIPEGTFVVDITADQFGESSFKVIQIDEADAHYVRGDQDLVNSHIDEISAEIELEKIFYLTKE